ncbi:MAG: hypothetical protein HUJ31_19040, partial [Pseudomonadales bacterium]|nr:hypothetical protein [Pseudomonadales bacterium]
MDRQIPAVLTVAFVSLAGLGFFWLNRQIPLFADDYCRFADAFDASAIISGVASEYMDWSGRFPVLFLTRLMLSLGEAGLLLFDVLNVLFVFAFGYVVLDYARVNRSMRPVSLFSIVAIFLCLFWFTPFRLGEVVLWKTGAVQYFWGTTIALLALKPVIDRVVADTALPVSRATLLSWCVLCFLGGAWLENLSVAVIAVWALLLMVRKFHFKQSVDVTLLIGLGFWITGAFVL